MTRRLAALPSVLALASLVSLAPMTACNGHVDTTSAPDGAHGRFATPLPSATPITLPAPMKTPTTTVLIGLGAPPDALACDREFVYFNEGGTVFRVGNSGMYQERETVIPGGTGPTPAIIVDDSYAA